MADQPDIIEREIHFKTPIVTRKIRMNVEAANTPTVFKFDLLGMLNEHLQTEDPIFKATTLSKRNVNFVLTYIK